MTIETVPSALMFPERPVRGSWGQTPDTWPRNHVPAWLHPCTYPPPLLQSPPLMCDGLPRGGGVGTRPRYLIVCPPPGGGGIAGVRGYTCTHIGAAAFPAGRPPRNLLEIMPYTATMQRSSVMEAHAYIHKHQEATGARCTPNRVNTQLPPPTSQKGPRWHHGHQKPASKRCHADGAEGPGNPGGSMTVAGMTPPLVCG